MQRSFKRSKLRCIMAVVVVVGLAVSEARAVDVLVAPARPTIDGMLGEWGAAHSIDISPAGDGVGLRGAFDGLEDHWAAVHLLWDADSLYIAVSVMDDVLDRQPVAPGDNEWKGPAGERKDKMFYYDHLKVFLRGPEQPLGFNLWLAPGQEGGRVHAWGGQQRGVPQGDLPLEMASQVRSTTYSYELAIPWTWLRIYPRPDMVIDGLFLFPDSDLPELELRKKIAQSNKWIWWQGKLVLRGNPPGLREVPESDVAEEIAQQKSQIVVPQVVAPPKAPKPEPAPAAAAETVPDSGQQVVSEDDAVAKASTEQTEDASAVEATSAAPAMAELRARLNRNLLARASVSAAPQWVREVAGKGVNANQVDSLYFRFGETIERISRDNISSRSDGLVMDMAEYAGVWRAQARTFLRGVIGAVLTDVEGDAALTGTAILRAAAAAGVEEERTRSFIRHLCKEALSVYEKNKIAATGDLVERARRKADIPSEKMQPLIEALVAQWRQ